MVANPARGQLNRENALSPFTPDNLVSLYRFGLNLVLTHGIPPAFHGGVHVYSSVNRHRTSR